jgi:peroxiredoxin
MNIVEKYEMEGKRVPDCTWHTRVRDPKVGGDNPYRWQDVSSDELFSGRKVIVFSLPGAFTPTCSTYQLPDFEKMHGEFKEKGIDDIYCISVNDSFVMNQWAKDQDLKSVKVIPDGSCDFTREMGMLVTKDNLGFGLRSWRYAMVVDNGVIEKMFVEPGKENNCEDDPYGETSPQNIIKTL